MSQYSKRKITEKLLGEVEKRISYMGTNKIASDLGLDDGIITACTDVLRSRQRDKKLAKEKEEKERKIVQKQKEDSLPDVAKRFDFFKPDPID